MHKDRIHWALNHSSHDCPEILPYSLLKVYHVLRFSRRKYEGLSGILYTLCQIPRETVSFVSPRVLMFPETKSREHHDSKENKTNCFPEGPDIKCFVVFLDFHFNSNKRITGVNQNSRLGTYNNKSLILSILSVYYLRLFPPVAAVSLLGWL